MDKDVKIEVVGRLRASEILGCNSTEFYNKHYPILKDFSILGKDKRKRLFRLDKVMEIKRELDAKDIYVIVE